MSRESRETEALLARAQAWLHGPERWLDGRRLDVPLWHRRTRIVARAMRDHLARSGERVRPLALLDVGCGAMALERILAEEGMGHFVYLPADLHPRDARTLCVDLNLPDLAAHLPDVDVAFVGGVLEYLAEPERVLRALAARSRYLYLAYCVRTPEQPLHVRRGWRNHISREELVALLGTLGEVEVEPVFAPGECPHTVLAFLLRRPEAAGLPLAELPEVA